MAFAQRIITSNSAGDQEFTFTFDYIKEEHIKVFVNFVEKAQGTGSSEFQVITNTTPKKVRLNTGLSANNTRVEIRRVSSLSTPLVDFADGSTLTATDLDTAEKQSLFIDQELDDALKQGISIDTSTGIPTLSSQRLSNVADPVNAQDVVTKAYLERSGSITSTQIAADAVDGTKIADNAIGVEHLEGNSVDTNELIDNAVTEGKLAANAVTTAKIPDDAITYAKIQNVSATDRILGRDSSGAGIIEEITPANLRTMLNVEDGATADQTAAEIRTLVEAASDSNVFTDADHTKLNAIEASADVTDATNVDAAGAVMNSDTTTAAMQFVVDEDNFNSNLDTKVPTQQSVKAYITATSQPLDSELTQLSGMQSGTASKLADSTALTADLADLNQLDGMAKQTTITDDHTKFPTSGAVVDFVAAQIAPIGGLEVIANEDSFPTTQPASGVVISISDIEGLIVNGSGVATNARTSGNGSDNVTINGFPSSLQSKTMAAGLGLMVSSTGSSQTYTYHKLLAKEADVEQLSNDINDFAARYRVTNGEPTSNNDEGDLIYDKNADKMKVFDSSTNSFKEVTSVGDYKFLFLCPAGGSGSPTINGSIATYDLREGSTSGSAASITNAAQLIVSINGVIQKPNTGTSAPSEGFAMVDSNTIIFGSNLPTGAEVFIIQIGSATTLNVPADNSVATAKIQNQGVTTAKIADDAVTSAKIAADSVGFSELAVNAIGTENISNGVVTTAKIADDTITNAKINSSAAIAGSKISPDFGSQDIKTTGTIEVPTINDGQLGNRNMIINGDMQCNQRGNKTGLTSTDYAIDRFKIGITNIGTYSVSQSDNSADTATTGCRYSLKLDCTTADASPAAADVLSISQTIEGQHMTRLAWGTAGGQKKATLSFWAKADINGFTSGTKDFVVEIQTSSSHEFSVVCQLTANSTWQKFVIVFDAFASATLVRNNTGAATINWWLAAGSNYKGGTYSSGWQQKGNTGGVRAAGLTLDLSAHTDNNFYLTAVQFELGEKATTFEHKLYQQELSLCQRYYQQLGSTNTGFGGDFAMLPAYTYNVGTRIAASFITNSKMRTTPSIAEIGNGVRVYGQGTNSDVATIFGIMTADDTNAVAFTLDGNSSFDWGDSDHAMVVTNKTGGGMSFSAEF